MTVNVLDTAFYAFGESLVSAVVVLPAFMLKLGASPSTVALLPALQVLGARLPPLATSYLVEGQPRVLRWCLLMGVGQRVPWLAVGLIALFAGRGHPTLVLVALLVGVAASCTSFGLGSPAYGELIAKAIPAARRGLYMGLNTMIGSGDRADQREVALRADAPRGSILNGGRRSWVEPAAEGQPAVKDEPLVANGRAWSGRIALAGRSGAKLVFPWDGPPPAKPQISRQQFFARGVLNRVEPEKPLILTIKINPELLARAKSARVRLVLENVTAGLATMKVNAVAMVCQNTAELRASAIWKTPVAEGEVAVAVAIAGDAVLCATNRWAPPARGEEPAPPGAGRLQIISLADGTERQRLELPQAVVHQGLSIHDGRVVVSCRDGLVLCFGE